jgi:hypothetical protein
MGQGYVHEVVIACASEVIARQQRSYEREIPVQSMMSGSPEKCSFSLACSSG